MENFEFYNPTKVIFGKGAETRVGAEIASRGFKKVLVHFGGTYLSETGVLDRIHESLKTAGIEYVDFGGVVPNPRLSHVKEGVALCKKESIDFILGVQMNLTLRICLWAKLQQPGSRRWAVSQPLRQQAQKPAIQQL